MFGPEQKEEQKKLDRIRVYRQKKKGNLRIDSSS